MIIKTSKIRKVKFTSKFRIFFESVQKINSLYEFLKITEFIWKKSHLILSLSMVWFS